MLIFGCWARYKSCKCEVTEEFPLFGPQVLALMEFCHIRAYFSCKADMYKVCNCPARSPPFARPKGVGQAVGRAVALPPPGARSFTLAPPHPAIPARSLNPFLHPCARPPARSPPPFARSPLRPRSPAPSRSLAPPPLAPPSIMNLRPRRAGLPQVIPQPELEAWLAKRVTFHSSNREALRTALKTYLNGGKAIVDAAGPGSAVPAASTWVEDIDDDPAMAVPVCAGREIQETC